MNKIFSTQDHYREWRFSRRYGDTSITNLHFINTYLCATYYEDPYLRGNVQKVVYANADGYVALWQPLMEPRLPLYEDGLYLGAQVNHISPSPKYATLWLFYIFLIFLFFIQLFLCFYSYVYPVWFFLIFEIKNRSDCYTM